jgi:hypothetical protein
MRADTEDQLRVEPKPGGFPVVTLLMAVAALVGLLLFWFWSSEEEVESPDPEPVVAVADPVVVPAPDIPRRVEPEAPVSEPAAEPEAVAEIVKPALPSPEQSDEMLRRQLDVAGADVRLNGLIGSEHPLETSAALIDGMSRGILLRKILPADPPEEPFVAVEEGDVAYMSEASYARYDSYADSIASLDVDALVEGFHQLRPVYERAYAQLGLDPDDFDNAIVRTLDVILATPEIDEPIALERKSVMYTYADPDLEQLSSVQKQLLRMGPDNIRRIKKQAQRVREGLLQ